MCVYICVCMYVCMYNLFGSRLYFLKILGVWLQSVICFSSLFFLFYLNMRQYSSFSKKFIQKIDENNAFHNEMRK